MLFLLRAELAYSQLADPAGRPACDVTIFLANSEPSTHGTFCTGRRLGPIKDLPMPSTGGTLREPARALWRAHPGCCLPDLNQVAVNVPDVRADFGAMLLGLGEELSAAR